MQRLDNKINVWQIYLKVKQRSDPWHFLTGAWISTSGPLIKMWDLILSFTGVNTSLQGYKSSTQLITSSYTRGIIYCNSPSARKRDWKAGVSLKQRCLETPVSGVRSEHCTLTRNPGDFSARILFSHTLEQHSGFPKHSLNFLLLSLRAGIPMVWILTAAKKSVSLPTLRGGLWPDRLAQGAPHPSQPQHPLLTTTAGSVPGNPAHPFHTSHETLPQRGIILCTTLHTSPAAELGETMLSETHPPPKHHHLGWVRV